MEDPLLKLKRISNPYSLSFFTKDEKRILLLGDIHLYNTKDCVDCKLPTCATYITLVDELDKYHKDTQTELDVFIESFSPEVPKNFMNKTKIYLISKANSLFLGTIHLYNLRKHFASKIYFHGRDEKQRYHYIDLRFTKVFRDHGFDMNKVLSFNKISNQEKRAAKITDYYNTFRELYPTQTSYVKIILDLCFGKPFRPNYKERDGLSHDMTYISKQFHKLRLKEQQFVKKFIKSQILSIMKQYNYNNINEFLSNIFWMCALITDTYTICRFLRFFNKQVANSTSVIIAGARHTYIYHLFLKEFNAAEIFNRNHNEKILLGNFSASHNKCIHIKK